jgi:hypothetical protein
MSLLNPTHVHLNTPRRRRTARMGRTKQHRNYRTSTVDTLQSGLPPYPRSIFGAELTARNGTYAVQKEIMTSTSVSFQDRMEEIRFVSFAPPSLRVPYCSYCSNKCGAGSVASDIWECDNCGCPNIAQLISERCPACDAGRDTRVGYYQ